ncbi:MAG: hypothetical protein M1444_01225 [Patescibacteria group bacterium]|nr:hypothetical protein [Patescibacteria group bacterium]
MNNELGKTPTKYAGLKPDLDDSFLPYWKKWSDEEKLEYVRYLERDTIRGTFKFTIFIIIFLIIIFIFLYFGNPVD